MAEPSKYPEWTSNNPGQIIEPDAAKKQAGWAAGERPPNQYMNWLQNLEYLWAKLLNEKTKNIEPIQLRSAATAAWNGATLTFAQPIEIVFRNGNSPTRINKILAAGSPIALADGQVVVVNRDRSAASPVTLTLQAVYANLTAGQYAIVAESSLTSTNQENEMVLFRRNGTDLEVPMLGIKYPTGTTITFGEPFPGAHTHDTADIVSGTLADARIAVTNVTQWQASLSIAETQIPDGSIFPRLAGNEAITGAWTFNTALPSSNINPTNDDHLVRKGWVTSVLPTTFSIRDVGIGAIETSSSVTDSAWIHNHEDAQRAYWPLSRDGANDGRIYFTKNGDDIIAGQTFTIQQGYFRTGPYWVSAPGSGANSLRVKDNDSGPTQYAPTSLVSVGGGEFYYTLDGAPNMSVFTKAQGARFLTSNLVVKHVRSTAAFKPAGTNVTRMHFYFDNFMSVPQDPANDGDSFNFNIAGYAADDIVIVSLPSIAASYDYQPASPNSDYMTFSGGGEPLPGAFFLRPNGFAGGQWNFSTYASVGGVTTVVIADIAIIPRSVV